LLLKDRLSTRDIIKRKNMQLESYNCVVCNLSAEETSAHLFLNCPFAKQCWSSIGISFQGNIIATEAILEIRSQANNRFFMISAILMSWAKEVFKKEIQLLTLRAKAKDSALFDQWIQNHS